MNTWKYSGHSVRHIIKPRLIRVSENFVIERHMDTDEANAAVVANGDTVRILGKSVLI